MTPEPLEAVLSRLKKERDEADARYNEALTALDRALRPAVTIPSPAPGIDDHQVGTLNEAWNILPAPPHAAGFKGRLAGVIWRVVAPYFQRQLTFNSLLVDHINRSTAATRDAHRGADAIVVALRDHLAGLAEFQSRMMLLLQQVTAYVDTRDRESRGGALVLNESLSGLAENMAKRLESLAAREQRYDARTQSIAAAHDELRATLGVVQHGFMTIKREIENRFYGVPQGSNGVLQGSVPQASTGVPPGSVPPGSSPGAPRAGRQAFSGTLDSYKYVGFEDQFRG